MNTASEITVTHSERRPKGQAWCASSGGCITYAGSRDEAIEKHRGLLDTYGEIDRSIQMCAAHLRAVTVSE